MVMFVLLLARLCYCAVDRSMYYRETSSNC